MSRTRAASAGGSAFLQRSAGLRTVLIAARGRTRRTDRRAAVGRAQRPPEPNPRNWRRCRRPMGSPVEPANDISVVSDQRPAWRASLAAAITSSSAGLAGGSSGRRANHRRRSCRHLWLGSPVKPANDAKGASGTAGTLSSSPAGSIAASGPLVVTRRLDRRIQQATREPRPSGVVTPCGWIRRLRGE